MRGCAYVGDNSVSIVCGDEVLDWTRCCVLQLVSTDEVVGKGVLCGVAFLLSVHDWNGAICVCLDAVGDSFGGICQNGHCGW